MEGVDRGEADQYSEILVEENAPGQRPRCGLAVVFGHIPIPCQGPGVSPTSGATPRHPPYSRGGGWPRKWRGRIECMPMAGLTASLPLAKKGPHEAGAVGAVYGRT